MRNTSWNIGPPVCSLISGDRIQCTHSTAIVGRLLQQKSSHKDPASFQKQRWTSKNCSVVTDIIFFFDSINSHLCNPALPDITIFRWTHKARNRNTMKRQRKRITGKKLTGVKSITMTHPIPMRPKRGRGMPLLETKTCKIPLSILLNYLRNRSAHNASKHSGGAKENPRVLQRRFQCEPQSQSGVRTQHLIRYNDHQNHHSLDYNEERGWCEVAQR